jgi:hypothetical protein
MPQFSDERNDTEQAELAPHNNFLSDSHLGVNNKKSALIGKLPPLQHK